MSMEESVQHVVMMAIQEVSYCLHFSLYCALTLENYLPGKNICLCCEKLVDMVNLFVFW